MVLNGEFSFRKWRRMAGVYVVILVQNYTQPTVYPDCCSSAPTP